MLGYIADDRTGVHAVPARSAETGGFVMWRLGEELCKRIAVSR